MLLRGQRGECVRTASRQLRCHLTYNTCIYVFCACHISSRVLFTAVQHSSSASRPCGAVCYLRCVGRYSKPELDAAPFSRSMPQVDTSLTSPQYVSPWSRHCTFKTLPTSLKCDLVFELWRANTSFARPQQRCPCCVPVYANKDLRSYSAAGFISRSSKWAGLKGLDERTAGSLIPETLQGMEEDVEFKLTGMHCPGRSQTSDMHTRACDAPADFP